MGAGRIAGVAGVIAVIAIGAFLLWSAGTSSRPAAPPPVPRAATAPIASAEPVPDAAAPGAGPAVPTASDAPAAPAARAPAGPGSIAGLLVYGDSVTPAPGVLVVLARGPEGSTDEVGRTRSDEQGRFAFASLAAGEHSFSTLTAEGEMWDHDHVTVTVEEGKPSDARLWVEKPLPPGTGIRVTGTVRYGDGRPAGRFRFEFEADDGDDSRYRVESVDGAFDRRLPAAGSYRVWSVEADGQEWEDLELELQVVEGTPVAIVLPLPSDGILAVVARGTGAPIAGARVFRFVEEDRAWLFDEHPNAATLAGEPLRADGQGVVNLGPGTNSETVFVVAEGFSWRRVEVRRDSGPMKVALAPGGTLRLSIPGWAALQDASLAAEPHEKWRRWELPAPGPDGTGVYEGLAAGEWTVRIRRGMAHKEGELYGEAAVTIPAGGEVSLEVGTRAPGVRRPAPVYGTVLFPAEWGPRETTLSFQGVSPALVDVERSVPLAARGDGKPIPFLLPGVFPGDYQVTIDPQFHATVRVPAEGKQFEFRVPPPGTVLLRLVDDATEAPVERADVWWHVVTTRRSYSLEDAARGDAPGTHRIVAPAGTIRVSIQAAGYARSDATESGSEATGDENEAGIVVAAGVERSITIRMKRAGSVRVELKCEGDPSEWDDLDIALVRRNADGDEVDWHWLDEGRGVAKSNDAPTGNWELRIRGLEEEFEEVPLRPVTVVAGETTTVEVTLVRKK